MQRRTNSPIAKRAITVVLLFGFAFAASGAEQMMRTLSAPAAMQPTAVPKILPPSSPGGTQSVVGAQGAQPMSSQSPDVFIQEAILSYPSLNAEFHIVFPNQPGRSAIPLNLYPTAAVPAAQGSTLDSDQRFPVLSCDRALTANLRVIVGNKGQKAYDGTPPNAGVTATVAAAQLAGGFALINSQQSQTVNLGPLSLKPGTFAFGIVANQGKTGGELNFFNNVARGSFEIRCLGASGPTPGMLPPPDRQATPRQINAGELTMTGQRVDSRAVTTGELTMTGQRVDSRAVITGELTMTGQRVDSRAATGTEIKMTGRR